MNKQGKSRGYFGKRFFEGVSRQFTLIELLTVIAIIGILAALLLPALARAKYIAKLAVCLNNQKQVGIGVTMYANDNDLRYPAPSVDTVGSGTYLIGRQLVRGVDRSVGQIMDESHMDYYGGWGGAKGIFMCPLIEGEYASRMNNYETKFPYHNYVPFSLFFNWGGPGYNPIERPMTRVGTTWKIKSSPNWRIQSNSRGKESDILVGDYLGRIIGYTGLKTMYVNHNDPGNSIIEVVRNSDYFVNYSVFQPTSGNFLRSDLSGATYKNLHYDLRPDVTGGLRGYASGSEGGIVPLELLK